MLASRLIWASPNHLEDRLVDASRPNASQTTLAATSGVLPCQPPVRPPQRSHLEGRSLGCSKGTAPLPPDSVNWVITSPPGYWQRDGVAGPAGQGGTVAAYFATCGAPSEKRVSKSKRVVDCVAPLRERPDDFVQFGGHWWNAHEPGPWLEGCVPR
jgi:hypothetical protein